MNASSSVLAFSGTGTAGDIINGNDIIEGGAGNDQMWGDSQSATTQTGTGAIVVAGDDNFVFTSGQDGTADIIWDYNAWDTNTNQGDTITLNNYTGGYTVDTFTDQTVGGVLQSGMAITAGDETIYVVGISAETDLHILV